MRPSIVVLLVALLACQARAAPPDLAPVEMRWLQGAWPVLLYARESKLPLDIVVQPQPVADAPPIHPQQYAQLHAWLVAERSAGQVAGAHHDTLVWLRRAAQGRALVPDAAPGAAPSSIFAAAAELWAAGLADDD